MKSFNQSNFSLGRTIFIDATSIRQKFFSLIQFVFYRRRNP